jgi:hypothetical protein
MVRNDDPVGLVTVTLTSTPSKLAGTLNPVAGPHTSPGTSMSRIDNAPSVDGVTPGSVPSPGWVD